jgi:D-glycero-alpha-D-manno-heptose 1-phosphate guanylyltransferase
MKCIAIVLAGGMGTRIRHLLPDLPKPLAPIEGEPFLGWVLKYLQNQKVQNIVISVGYMAEKIQEYVSENKLGLNLLCIREDFPLGTAGGALNAMRQCAYEFSNVLVLNGDSVVLADLTPLFQSMEDESTKVAMLGVRVSNAARYGTLEIKENNYLVGFNEKQEGAGLVNAGIYLFRQEILNQFSSDMSLSFELDIFPKLLSQNVRIKVIPVDAPFIDIGTEDSLGDASLFIKNNLKYFFN